MKRFWQWLRNPTPETTLVNYIRQRRRQSNDEAIRLEAYCLWEADGRPEGRSDYYYHKALQKRRSLGRRIMAPFFWLEKQAIEPISGWMNRADLFNILEKAGILIAVFVFLVEYGERREKAIYEAWTVVKTGQEEQSGVVGMALERLHREKFSLEGIDVEGTYLAEVNLERAYLGVANLEGADLWRANLKGASLGGTNLKEAQLLGVNLEGADLWRANLEGATLAGVNLKGAYLGEVNLKKAKLWNSSLKGADFENANLKEASLFRVNLKGVDLEGANLEGAKYCETTMPDGTLKTHKPDCPKELQ